jgi:hypothetical protein
MIFSEAIKSGFQNYVNFSGRAARSEQRLVALARFHRHRSVYAPRLVLLKRQTRSRNGWRTQPVRTGSVGWGNLERVFDEINAAVVHLSPVGSCGER